MALREAELHFGIIFEFLCPENGSMDEQAEIEQRPASNRLMLALVLSVVGLGAIGMLVLAAASVVFR